MNDPKKPSDSRARRRRKARSAQNSLLEEQTKPSQGSEFKDDDDEQSVAVAEGDHEDSVDAFLFEELQERLQEKEELVTALTQRLEQTVEQLDRVHRTGGDRGVRASGGGIPSEFLEQQTTISNDVSTLLEEWTNLEAAATLGRLETQIGELRDLMIQQPGGLSVALSGMGNSAPASSSASKENSANGDGGSVWESMKAQMLNGEQPSIPEPTRNLGETEAVTEAEQGPNGFSLHDHLLDLNDFTVPSEVIFQEKDRPDVRHAIEQRDECITTLLKQLRTLGKQCFVPPEWEILSQAPEELIDSVTALQERMHETLRISEVEISLERARLAREESRLKLLEDQLEKCMKKAGINLDGPEEDSGKESQREGRWSRFLGLGQNEK